MNRTLANTAKSLLYHKEYRKLFDKSYTTTSADGKETVKTKSGSVLAVILLSQLEYYSARHPNGFYKFLSPCDHPAYNNGDSWTEELGFSEDEFRSAFAEVGKAHKSKKDFDNAADKFDGKFYASYFDRIKGKTFYFRNHELLDRKIAEINNEVDLRNSTTSIYGTGAGQDTETDYVHFQYIGTEITTENTHKEETRVIADAEKPLSETTVAEVLNVEPSAFTQKCFEILETKRMDSPLSLPEWSAVFAYAEKLTPDPMHFAGCIESVEKWAKGRITPKMVSDNLGKYLNELEKQNPPPEKYEIIENSWSDNWRNLVNAEDAENVFKPQTEDVPSV